MYISNALSEVPGAMEALMIKSRDSQDIGSNETTKEEKNNFKKGDRGDKPGEQRAEDIPVHMPTMSHNDAISAM